MSPSNSLRILATTLLAASTVQSHYIFSQLIVNGAAVGSDYSFIRKNTNSYQPSFTADVVNSANSICNVGAQNAKSQTYDVKAGDKIGFKLSFNEFIEHPGPGFVYMSKADGDVASYDGSGDWFKAYEIGLTRGGANLDENWGSWQKDRLEFTIPKDTPDGEYLVRPEHIAIHEAHVGKAQFYMECAQLRISGGGSGTPGPLVKFPGAYSAQDPGIAYNKWSNSPTAYVMPGPSVWTGGALSGASSTVSTGSSETATDATSTAGSETIYPDSSSSETSAAVPSGIVSNSGSSNGSATGPWSAPSAPAASAAPAQGGWWNWNSGSSSGNQWGHWNGRVKGRRTTPQLV